MAIVVGGIGGNGEPYERQAFLRGSLLRILNTWRRRPMRCGEGPSAVFILIDADGHQLPCVDNEGRAVEDFRSQLRDTPERWRAINLTDSQAWSLLMPAQRQTIGNGAVRWGDILPDRRRATWPTIWAALSSAERDQVSLWAEYHDRPAEEPPLEQWAFYRAATGEERVLVQGQTGYHAWHQALADGDQGNRHPALANYCLTPQEADLLRALLVEGDTSADRRAEAARWFQAWALADAARAVDAGVARVWRSVV